MEAAVFGNVTLDVICWTVDDVPRYDSIAFDRVIVSPGGCGSNVAIGLCHLGVSTGLVCRLGIDEPSNIIEKTWNSVGLDMRYVHRDPTYSTAVSVGLVDSNAQPRFIHTPGTNANLTTDDLNINQLAQDGVGLLHIGGFFVLPGILDDRFAPKLRLAREMGMITTLDVVNSFRIKKPEPLWPCMPYLDVFLCNQTEGNKLTGENDPLTIGESLRSRGARNVIIKLGSKGCLVVSDSVKEVVSAPEVKVVDTTGAGDAFAAGLIASLLQRENLVNACVSGNQAGARMVGTLGAIGGWM